MSLERKIYEAMPKTNAKPKYRVFLDDGTKGMIDLAGTYHIRTIMKMAMQECEAITLRIVRIKRP